MVVATPHHVFSYEEYLERERVTGLKHEFLEGHVFAMAGGTPEHARLIAEVSFALRSLIDPRRCRVFSSELKVRVRATGLVTYPDVAVVCGDVERDEADPNAVLNPTILVEVLSPSTEAYDRGEKWAHYRRIEGLAAYVLVSVVPARLEVYERQANGDFVHRVAERGETLALACAGGALEVDALYAAAL
ncbi:MAG: Uma2 family endonuclease [Polyangiaceae bacterium]|nr:Uma2 family endonuclease [Polyangiaceae bacterium]MBK8939689.1 Uma2 family endonuclease [Polyangiaceae bacterium]